MCFSLFILLYLFSPQLQPPNRIFPLGCCCHSKKENKNKVLLHLYLQISIQLEKFVKLETESLPFTPKCNTLFSLHWGWFSDKQMTVENEIDKVRGGKSKNVAGLCRGRINFLSSNNRNRSHSLPRKYYLGFICLFFHQCLP
jgi:hypothetical protein